MVAIDMFLLLESLRQIDGFGLVTTSKHLTTPTFHIKGLRKQLLCSLVIIVKGTITSYGL